MRRKPLENGESEVFVLIAESVWVCMQVCLSGSLNEHICVNIYIYMYIHIYVFTHLCVHLESQVDILACTPTWIQESVQIPLTVHSPGASYTLGGITLSPESIQHRSINSVMLFAVLLSGDVLSVYCMTAARPGSGPSEVKEWGSLQ